jgi:hypothetical protein
MRSDGVAWAAGAAGDAVGFVGAASLWSERLVGIVGGTIAWSRPGMTCRSWLYWSSIVCVGLSVAVVGDGSVGCSFVGLVGASTGLVGEASLVGEAG